MQQAGKPFEVVVRRTQFCGVFYGQRGDVGIRRQIAASSAKVDEIAQNFPVALSGVND